MISTSVKLSGMIPIKQLQIDVESYFGNDMVRLGEFAIKTIKARVAQGIGSDDAPMPPLSVKTSPIAAHGLNFVRQRLGYAKWKSLHGLRPIRDLMGTGKDGGHMLDNISVRAASKDAVRISLTEVKAREKALSNERKSPWFSFSPSDELAIVAYAEQMFHSRVEVIRRQIFSGSARNGRYVDVSAPLQLQSLDLVA